MKKLLICLTLLVFIAAAAHAEPLYESVRVEFQNEFALTLPADWVRFPVDSAAAESGMLYCLGSADASRLLYIQYQPVAYATLDELRADLEPCETLELRANSVSADSTEFIMYIDTENDAGGCMTLFDSGVLNLIFLPQSDPENMLIAATIMESAEILATAE